MDDPIGSKAWATAVEKLIDACRSGVGALAQPWLLKRNARAQVDAQKILAQGEIEIAALRTRALPPAGAGALDDANAIDVEFEEVDARVLTLDRRAHDRLEYQEQKRQLNVEKVIRAAADELGDEPATDAPVDEDWIARFFTTVQDVSAEDMQTLWAKILAGEIREPGSFSLRCLETVRNLTSKEANGFARLVPHAHDGAIFLEEVGVRFGEIMHLDDAGLVNMTPVRFVMPAPDEVPTDDIATLQFGDVRLELSPVTKTSRVEAQVYAFTIVGRQLATLIRGTPDKEFVVRMHARFSRRFNVRLLRGSVNNEWTPFELDAT